MSWAKLAVTALAAAAAPCSLAAQELGKADAEEAAVQRVVAMLNNPNADRCADRDQLHAELSNLAKSSPRLDSLIASTDLDCELRLRNYPAAYAAVERIDRNGGISEPNVGLGVLAEMKDIDGLVRRVNWLMTDANGPSLSRLDVRLYSHVMYLLREAGRGDDATQLTLRWVDSPNFQHLDPRLRSGLAMGAVDEIARSGKVTDHLRGLLEEIDEPTFFQPYLASRLYEAIWPQLEERVGPNLTRVTGDYVKSARADLEANPDNLDRFNGFINALYFDGQFEQVIANVSEWRDRSGSAPIAEGLAWAVNAEVFSLDALGRREDADQLMEWLVARAPQDAPWLISFALNRSIRLVGQGRPEQALKAAAFAREVMKRTGGSRYAETLIARDHACALNLLGRRTEAERELSLLRANAKTDTMPVVEGLLCLGLDDEAAAALLAQMADETSSARYAAEWQNDKFNLHYTPSAMRSVHQLVAARPELQQAMAKVARAVPERLYPASSLRWK